MPSPDAGFPAGKLQRGTLDFMIGRIPEKEDSSGPVYEELGEETACAVVRPGHALPEAKDPTPEDIAGKPWILPPPGSIPLPQQTDSLHVMPQQGAKIASQAGAAGGLGDRLARHA